jgi:hypothetical protein
MESTSERALLIALKANAAQRWLCAFTVMATLVLFVEGQDARRERQQLADDLYRLCDHLPVAFPALNAIVPKRYEQTQGQPFFRAQAALKEACEVRNANALRQARDRAQERL